MFKILCKIWGNPENGNILVGRLRSILSGPSSTYLIVGISVLAAPTAGLRAQYSLHTPTPGVRCCKRRERIPVWLRFMLIFNFYKTSLSLGLSLTASLINLTASMTRPPRLLWRSDCFTRIKKETTFGEVLSGQLLFSLVLRLLLREHPLRYLGFPCIFFVLEGGLG